MWPTSLRRSSSKSGSFRPWPSNLTSCCRTLEDPRKEPPTFQLGSSCRCLAGTCPMPMTSIRRGTQDPEAGSRQWLSEKNPEKRQNTLNRIFRHTGLRRLRCSKTNTKTLHSLTDASEAKRSCGRLALRQDGRLVVREVKTNDFAGLCDEKNPGKICAAGMGQGDQDKSAADSRRRLGFCSSSSKCAVQSRAKTRGLMTASANDVTRAAGWKTREQAGMSFGVKHHTRFKRR
ncbi:hypothetical protein GN956_G3649 [Arapaima gigas]